MGGLKIMVCVRPAAENASDAQAGRDGKGLTYKVNEYDLYAMEEAVRIKERVPGTEIMAVSVGLPENVAQLKKAMSLGADRGVLVDDSDEQARDALAIASLLAALIRPESPDLILCGVMSEDLQRCQTGAMLAELLCLPSATTVVAMELDREGRSVVCERELEGGVRERVNLSMPALITIQSGINVPRYASLTNVLRVKEMAVSVVKASSLGSVSSSERTVRSYVPERRAGCEILEGDDESVALELIEKIRALAPVL